MMNAEFQQAYEAIVTDSADGGAVRVSNALKKVGGGRPLVLYGAGEMGAAILDTCTELGLVPVRVCDRFKTGEFNGVPIIDLPILRRDFINAAVIVCTYTYSNQICKDLAQAGFAPEQIVPCPFEQPFLSKRQFQQYLDGYAWAYDFFEDARSKQLVIDRMRCYLNGTPMEINTPCACYYEEGVVALSSREVFVDGGAYNGDSAAEYLRRAGNQYASIYSFEPDSQNYEEAVRNLSKNPDVHVIQKGLWSKETELVFYENGGDHAASKLQDGNINTGLRVPVTSLDTFFSGKPDSELPTFIKLDIEGAEKEALIGSAEIIKRVKPKLAVCAYHKPEDVYELPRTIQDIRGDYRFCLRHYTRDYRDTILYAV